MSSGMLAVSKLQDSEICPVLIGMDIKMAMKLERVRAILVHVNPSKEFGPADLVTFP